tara:strand:+ start:667 stop:1038 length:372 start_codon:yes stop_codon:yes gene_type:complete
MSAETPEEFWYENIAKYQSIEPVDIFPQNLVVTCLSKMSNRDVAIFKGYLKNDDNIIITYPVSNHVIKNFIGVGIGDCEYTADGSVQVFDLDYPKRMTDDFMFSLLTDSYAWEILEYGDLSGY